MAIVTRLSMKTVDNHIVYWLKILVLKHREKSPDVKY